MRRRGLGVAMAAVAIVHVAGGNASPPWRPGDPVGEPAPEMAGLVIERETLTIDIRPVAVGEPAAIEAVYRVRNDGEARRVTLDFVATAMKGPGAVWLDGRELERESGPAGPLPVEWRAPEQTPGRKPFEVLTYQTLGQGTIRFAPEFGPGVHELKVRYRAEPGRYQVGEPTAMIQLGYVLAPARRWDGFGGLDVKVHLPAGWDSWAEPYIDFDPNDETVLARSFDDLPADSLAISAQAPVVAEWGGAWAGGAGLAGLVVAAIVGYAAGRRLGRRGRSEWRALALTVPTALLLPVLVIAAALAEQAIVAARNGPTADPTYGLNPYFLFFGGLIVAPLGFVVALAVGQVAARRGCDDGLAEGGRRP